MNGRPVLDKSLDADTFCNFYWLKDELLNFCRANGLPTVGSKLDIKERIIIYLKTGKIVFQEQKQKKKASMGSITKEMKIEPDFVCTEKHRAFFKEKIGKRFSFNVIFQKWLKDNHGKTLKQAIQCWNYKKSLPGNNIYDKSDLIALVNISKKG